MRPEDFSPGNLSLRQRWRREWHCLASMRPEDFSPGNLSLRQRWRREWHCLASMRPEDFSPGNCRYRLSVSAFSEVASMRPEDFSPGNMRTPLRAHLAVDRRFNEAGGFLPRKRDPVGARGDDVAELASMRPEDFSPGNAGKIELELEENELLQ